MEQLRQRLVERILATVGTQESFDEYRFPKGDSGFFGPSSVAWIVHRDLPSMLIGGVSALMFQTLHPLAMAGIAQHSNYQDDPLGRLHRTARFIAGTTYGPQALADRLVASVRSVHARVHGMTDDGRPYDANDPDLLTWVHITEVSSFLRSFERFGRSSLSTADKDRYYAEVSTLAYQLGATAVPDSTAAVAAYFGAVQSELAVTADAKQAVRFLRTPVSTSRAERFAHHLVVAESIELLPRFARSLLGLRAVPGLSALSARVGAESFSSAVRWAMGPSKIAALAAERVHGSS